MILGSGMTGITAGLVSGLPVFEAENIPGGICSSYYIKPNQKERLRVAPEDQEVYRFELGGGHWIFGGDPIVLRFVQSLAPFNTYYRKSSVYFHERNLYVPYVLQNHLGYLGADIAAQALAEIVSEPKSKIKTMADWLEQNFGTTLTTLFFGPFHELYTAGLWKEIAPQDAYKSPVSMPLVVQGAFGKTPPVGYNASFVYPKEGLNVLSQRMAQKCDIRYGKRVIAIDVNKQVVEFADGSFVEYEVLISTLPLNRVMEMAHLQIADPPDPYTSVLVLNIGAVKGPNCPDDHWLYNPDARSGFHRVGFYSNVDVSFLPKSAREHNNRVGIYVERAYQGGNKPSEEATQIYSQMVIQELQEWGFIEQVEVVDPTWIEVAYTWNYPDSHWKPQALSALEKHNIFQVGRYGQWNFQGIAASIRDGFVIGGAFK